ncbi:hypothetical protein BB559_005449 [Furculomyces boomerangus]|uniref:Uncharacterized protein n=1 Tax=Furculomyces boomerangus TaxID=61424 RepID=A0A2T9Y8Q5_9FUNG|nr:hypothetical protein BB559_005449 [Furculomyces boomerangus]
MNNRAVLTRAHAAELLSRNPPDSRRPDPDPSILPRPKRSAATIAEHAIANAYRKPLSAKTKKLPLKPPSKRNHTNPPALRQKRIPLNKPSAARVSKPFASSPIRGSVSMLLTSSFDLSQNPPCSDISAHLEFPNNIQQIKTMLRMDFKKYHSKQTGISKSKPPTSSSLDLNTSITLYPSSKPTCSNPSTSSNNSQIAPSQKTNLNHKTTNINFPLQSDFDSPFCDIEDLDAEDRDDPLMVSEYISEITLYLLSIEDRTMPEPNYISKQPEITWSMRELLINWVIRVHYQMMMLQETLFLAVNLIDRFLSKRFVAANKFQLVGIVSLLIASKYEEMNTRPIKDFLSSADNVYSENDVLSAERFMLRVLDFDLSYSGPLNFLRRVSKADNYNLQNRTVSKYFLEVSLVDYNFLCFKPSLVAAASIYLARKIFNSGGWNPTLAHYSNYTESQLLPCINQLIKYLANNTKTDIINTKYSQECFCHASIVCRKWATSHYSSIPIHPVYSPQKQILPKTRNNTKQNRSNNNQFGKENNISEQNIETPIQNHTTNLVHNITQPIKPKPSLESPFPDDASDITVVANSSNYCLYNYSNDRSFNH